MSIHVADSHHGDLYIVSKEDIDEVESYCELCGDWDVYLGEFDNVSELKKFCAESKWHRYDEEYIEKFFKDSQIEVTDD